MLRYFSVCSGIDAASVAWIPLGWEAVAFSEIEKFPSAVLAHHYPNVPNLGDMTKIDGNLYRGKVDVLVGGTPCQAFSVAGKRKSLEDDRGNLTLKFVELCDAIEPNVIVWENVPGVLSTKDNAFGIFLGGLSGAEIEIPSPGKRWGNAGYILGRKRNIAWRILDAQYFGLPQRRKRIFVIGCPCEGPDPREILFERTSVPRDFTKNKKTRESSTAKAKRSTENADFISHWEGGNIHPTLAISGGKGCPGMSNQDVFGQKGSCLVPVESLICIQGNMVRPNAGCHGKGWNDENISYTLTAGDRHAVLYENNPSDARVKELGVCPTIKARYGTGGGQTPYVMFENHSMDARVKEVKTCPTLRNNMGTSIPLLNEGYTIRRLMPIECGRLQGFKGNHCQIPWNGKPAEQCPDGLQYQAFGNSMAVDVITWLGKRIQKEMEAFYVRISTN